MPASNEFLLILLHGIWNGIACLAHSPDRICELAVDIGVRFGTEKYISKFGIPVWDEADENHENKGRKSVAVSMSTAYNEIHLL